MPACAGMTRLAVAWDAAMERWKWRRKPLKRLDQAMEMARLPKLATDEILGSAG
jgi:hypothetical protein